MFYSDGFEQKSRVKRPRAPPPPEEPENYVDDYDDLGERNNPLNSKYVPAGFLSPSVQEYLELGKSIPGKQKKITWNSIIKTSTVYYLFIYLIGVWPYGCKIPRYSIRPDYRNGNKMTLH